MTGWGDWTDYYLEPISQFIKPAPKQEEHLQLEVGDVVKLKSEAPLHGIPADTLLTITRVFYAGDGEMQYELDWLGKPTRYTVFMQYGADKYFKKLMRGPEEAELQRLAKEQQG